MLNMAVVNGLTNMTDQRKQHHLEEVENRLHKGWEACEAETDPAKRQRYENVWLQLLGQYQVLHDDLHGTTGKYTTVPKVALPV